MRTADINDIVYCVCLNEIINNTMVIKYLPFFYFNIENLASPYK